MQKAFSLLQKIGRSLMLPVAILPAAGILLGVGSANFSIIPELLNHIMAQAGGAVFGNLPLLFAIGVVLSLTDNDGVSSLAAIVGYVVLLATMGVMANTLGIETKTIMGIASIDTGVFGGILVGILASVMFNRFYKIQLPEYLGFFAGKRFVPIITAFAAIVMGVALSFIWPPIGNAIDAFGNYAVEGNPTTMGFVYGFVERLLIPFGLHHIWNVPFQSQMGEFVTASGVVVNGDIPRFFAGDPTAGFLAGGFLFKMFGLPAAAIAMWRSAKTENQKVVGGIMMSAALTSFLTGITEPIEFSFLFVAPILYGIHALLAGIAFVITNFFEIKMGGSFSHGLIDYALSFSIGTKPAMILVWGLAYAVLYYTVFTFAIKMFNLRTPGREQEAEAANTSEVGSELARKLFVAFGGQSNIKSIDACITRLRVTVDKPENVDVEAIKALGATAVLVVGQNMQAIFGPRSDQIKTEMNELMKSGQAPEVGEMALA
ncbi:PTS glucose transporter subunit IIBC [Endozoicomonas elysicola]|uniref:PTS glucose transporter subunit IIBC n=1 Tax=Endozoicomonas elysicola TaxID=305900 RepID=UPI0003A8ED56|nr:PTS glucose transporter subunit IIBC [Endozoicomonas elysicola]